LARIRQDLSAVEAADQWGASAQVVFYTFAIILETGRAAFAEDIVSSLDALNCGRFREIGHPKGARSILFEENSDAGAVQMKET
jgi:hypothetical protein